MKKYDTIIFDLDGTLLNTLEDITDAVNYAMDIYNFPKRTLEEVRSFVGNGIRSLLIKATPDGEENPQFEECFGKFKEYYKIHSRDKTKAYDGIMNLLIELKNKEYKMAIVSNKVDNAVKDLQELFFKDYISVALGDDGKRPKKPSPDSTLEAMRLLDSDSGHTIYVGDSDVDAKTAMNAGIDYVLVTWGFRNFEQLSQFEPKGFIHSPMQLVDIVEE